MEEWNDAHKLDGQENTRLTAFGEQQISNLSSYFAQKEIDVIVSSPLDRSYLTAEKIALTLNKKVQIINDLKEIDCGQCTGLVKKEIKKRYPKLVEEWNKNTDPPFPNGESLLDVEKRVIPVIEELVKKHKGKTVMVVAHGSVNIAIIGFYLGTKPGLRFKIRQDNCCINELKFKDDGVYINTINFVPNEVSSESHIS